MTLHTLSKPASHALEVKRSRFLAQAAPVTDAEAAMAWLADVADPQASHHCWAWRCGDQYRFHDDGEPSGTAGKPILLAIDGRGLDQVAVMVTRWFGGIKLGAGGLMRAYGGAAAECLRTAATQPLITMTELQLHAPFDALGQVHAVLATTAAEKCAEHFAADGVALHLRLPADRVETLAVLLRDATRDRARLEPIGDNG